MDLVVVPASSAQASASALPAGASSVSAISASSALSSKAALSAAPRQIAHFSAVQSEKIGRGLTTELSCAIVRNILICMNRLTIFCKSFYAE